MPAIQLPSPLQLGCDPLLMHRHGLFANISSFSTASSTLLERFRIHAWYDGVLCPSLAAGAAREFKVLDIIASTESEIEMLLSGSPETYVLFLDAWEVPAPELMSFLKRLDNVLTADMPRCVFHAGLLDFEQLYLFTREVISTPVLGLRIPEYTASQLQEILPSQLRSALEENIPRLIDSVSGQYDVIHMALGHMRGRMVYEHTPYKLIQAAARYLSSNVSDSLWQRRRVVLPTFFDGGPRCSTEKSIIEHLARWYVAGNSGEYEYYRHMQFYLRQAGWIGPVADDPTDMAVASRLHARLMQDSLDNLAA